MLSSSLFGDEYFASDRNGLLLKKIDPYEISSCSWYAAVGKEAGLLRKTLYDRSGTKIKEWRREMKDGYVETETLFEGNRKVVSSYEKNRLVEGSVFENGKAVSRTEYFYEGDLLSKRVEKDGAGIEIKSIVFHRNSDGRISGAEFISGDETIVSRYMFSDGILVREWHGKNDACGISVRYNGKGEIADISEWENNVKVQTEKYVYENDILKESIVSYPASGDMVFREYDASGDIVSEEERKENIVVKKSYFDYDDKSRLSKKTEIEGNDTYKILYFYDADKLDREEHYRNGIPAKRREYVSEERYYEDICAGGIWAFRIYYIGNKKVSKEEWLAATDTDG